MMAGARERSRDTKSTNSLRCWAFALRRECVVRAVLSVRLRCQRSAADERDLGLSGGQGGRVRAPAPHSHGTLQEACRRENECTIHSPHA